MSEFKDYREIESVLNLYTTALDTREFERLRDVFTPDALVSYPALDVQCDGVEAVIELVTGALAQCGSTQHLLGNVEIDVQGDQASASCYLQAIHLGLGDFEGEIYTVWGQYRDKLKKTASGWRISYRELAYIHDSGDIGLG